MIKVIDLYDLSHTVAGEYLGKFEYPFQALAGIKDYIVSLGKTLGKEYREVSPNVWVHSGATVAPTAYIGGPAVICEGAEIRHCAYIRGSALVGKNCVVGNSTELKNVILFDGVQVPHYNYVGDSILGYKAHMGAGSITSNVKSDKSNVVIHADTDMSTGLKKMGAMLGDFVDVGCNSVLNPGTVIGKRSQVYPLSSVRGVIPADSIYKGRDNVVKKG